MSNFCDDYFELKECSFEKNNLKEKTTIKRYTIFCKNLSNFINFICEKRNYDSEKMHLKIGVDSGGGFFKICLSFNDSDYLHNTNEKRKKFCYDKSIPQSQFKDSGVKKLFILCIVPDIQENYFNVLQLWNLLKLNEIIEKF